MRKRKSALFPSPSSSSSNLPADQQHANNDKDDDEEESGGSSSSSMFPEQEEDDIQGAHPSEPEEGRFTASPRKLLVLRQRQEAEHGTFYAELWKNLQGGKQGWVQMGMMCVAAVLTYSYAQTTNVQLAIMSVIVLFGAMPLASTPHLMMAGIGAFVGGQDIIYSNSEIWASDATTTDRDNVGLVHYLWLLLLSLVVGLVWRGVMVKHQILDGFAGRLGTTTFLGFNLIMLTIFGPANVVHWNRYFYGFVHALHVAEEDAALRPKQQQLVRGEAWSWTEEIELAIGYVLAVIWLAMVGGWIRIRHHGYMQERQVQPQQSSLPSPPPPPKPLNNVAIPCVLALLSMLLVNATQYRHKFGLYNGFAVGAYVAMASLQRLPTTRQFAMVSLAAAAWGLFLTPFFVGFAGKSGFTSMLGHVTFVWLQRVRQRVPEEPSPQGEPFPLQPASTAVVVAGQSPSINLPRATLPQEEEDEEESLPLRPSSPLAANKAFKPKQDTTLLTKQQRRQMQRLQHLQHKSSSLEDTSSTTTSSTPQHRGWQAGGGGWQHPLID